MEYWKSASKSDRKQLEETKERLYVSDCCNEAALAEVEELKGRLDKSEIELEEKIEGIGRYWRKVDLAASKRLIKAYARIEELEEELRLCMEDSGVASATKET